MRWLTVLLCWALLALASSKETEYHNYLEKFRSHEMEMALESGVKLWYNSTEVNRSGDWVEVSFSGVQRPHRMDIVALFVPADAYKRGSAPVKYEFAEQAQDYAQKGSGVLRFRVINLRQDMRFVLVRHPFKRPRVLAEGPVLRNGDPNELTGLHLMPGHRPV